MIYDKIFVRTSCPTTFGISSDMSKFWSANGRWPTVIYLQPWFSTLINSKRPTLAINEHDNEVLLPVKANLETYICKHETSPTLTCVKMFFNCVCKWSASVVTSSLKQTVVTFRWIIEQCSLNLRHVAALNFPPNRQTGFWIWQENKKANIVAPVGC